jgi:hypothetical protein
MPVQALYIALLLFSICSAKKHTPLTEPVNLPKVVWENDSQFVHKLTKEGEPVILIDTPAHRWPLITKWTPNYLSANCDKELGIKIHTDPKFPIGCCPLKPMTMSEFWHMAKSPPKGKYMYLNAQVELIGNNLVQDIGMYYMLALYYI